LNALNLPSSCIEAFDGRFVFMDVKYTELKNH
jgi:hypothetical protein